jgi:hypothetical protein
MNSHLERPDAEPGEAATGHNADHKESHELSKDERDRLRHELKNAPVLDFERYLSDNDYKLYIFENPAMRRIQDDIIANALMCIEDHTRDFSLSSEQMGKVIAIFEPGVRRRMSEAHEVETQMLALLRKAADSPVMRSLLTRAIEVSGDNHPGTGTPERAPEDQPGISA